MQGRIGSQRTTGLQACSFSPSSQIRLASNPIAHDPLRRGLYRRVLVCGRLYPKFGAFAETSVQRNATGSRLYRSRHYIGFSCRSSFYLVKQPIKHEVHPSVPETLFKHLSRTLWDSRHDEYYFARCILEFLDLLICSSVSGRLCNLGFSSFLSIVNLR